MFVATAALGRTEGSMAAISRQTAPPTTFKHSYTVHIHSTHMLIFSLHHCSTVPCMSKHSFTSKLYLHCCVTLLQMYENIKLQYSPQLLKLFFFSFDRCLFKINPDKGSKVERNATKKLAVSPKVLTLITKIADYEWRE